VAAAIEQTIIDLFGVIYRNLVREENDWVEVGKDSRNAALSVLRRGGGCSMSELARFLRMTSANITFLVDKLQAQGLVERQADPDDRRRTIVNLTPSGRDEIDGRKREVAQRVRRKLAALAPSDRDYLLQTLPKVMEILGHLYSETTTNVAGGPQATGGQSL